MEFIKYWEIKNCQKSLKNCTKDNTLVIGIGHIHNAPDIKIGETIYVDKQAIWEHYVPIENLRKTMSEDFLVITLEDLHKQPITEIDYDIAVTLYKQSQQIKKQQTII